MPAYYRIAIDGNFVSTPEVWSTSFAATSSDTPPDQANMNSWAEAILTYLGGTSTPAQQLRAWMSSVGQITRVRIYWYQSIGASAALVAASTGAGFSGSGTVIHPPQLAAVYSLLTGIPGRRYRGRMYWPAVGISTGTTFTSSGLNLSAAQNFAQFLDAVTTLEPGPESIQPAVVSTVGNVVTPVTAVSLDNVLDTQRRRRDALVGSRYTAPIP